MGDNMFLKIIPRRPEGDVSQLLNLQWRVFKIWVQGAGESQLLQSAENVTTLHKAQESDLLVSILFPAQVFDE